MTSDPNREKYYQDCVYYPFGKDYEYAFRYGTELFGGKICLPTAESLGEEGFETF